MGTSCDSACCHSGKDAELFNDSEYRFGAFAGAVALVLVLALTVMAFTALEPQQRASANWDVSLPEAQPVAIPSFAQ